MQRSQGTASQSTFTAEDLRHAKRDRQQRNLPIKGRLRIDGSPVARGAIGRVPVLLGFDQSMNEWLRDRAAAFGVPLNVLVRDVLATWRSLVLKAEADLGLRFDLDEPAEIAVPERFPGYRAALQPPGDLPSHLDPTPLGFDER